MRQGNRHHQRGLPDMQEAASEAIDKAWTKAEELLADAQNDTTDTDELLRRLISVVSRLCSGVKMMQIAARVDTSSGVDTLLEDNGKAKSVEDW